MKWAFYFAASRTKLADFLRGGCTQTGLRATGQSHHTKIMFRSKTLKTAALLAMLGCATLFSATRVETFTDLALSADSYWNGSDLMLTISLVPEPAYAAGLLGFAALLLAARRRK